MCRIQRLVKEITMSFPYELKPSGVATARLRRFRRRLPGNQAIAAAAQQVAIRHSPGSLVARLRRPHAATFAAEVNFAAVRRAAVAAASRGRRKWIKLERGSPIVPSAFASESSSARMGNQAFNVIVVLFWLATMSWLVVAKIVPPLRVGEPPNYARSSQTATTSRPPAGPFACEGEPIGWAANKIGRRTGRRSANSTAASTWASCRWTKWPPAGWPACSSRSLPTLELMDIDKQSRFVVDPLGRLVGLRIAGPPGRHARRDSGAGHGRRLDAQAVGQSGDVSATLYRTLSPNALMSDELSPQTADAGPARWANLDRAALQPLSRRRTARWISCRPSSNAKTAFAGTTSRSHAAWSSIEAIPARAAAATRRAAGCGSATTASCCGRKSRCSSRPCISSGFPTRRPSELAARWAKTGGKPMPPRVAAQLLEQLRRPAGVRATPRPTPTRSRDQRARAAERDAGHDRNRKRHAPLRHESGRRRSDLQIPPGELFAFLGPNGAGKTTTIKMIVGLLRPSSGTIRLCGHDVGQRQQRGQPPAGLRARRAVSVRQAVGPRVPAVHRRHVRPGQARGRTAKIAEQIEAFRAATISSTI